MGQIVLVAANIPAGGTCSFFDFAIFVNHVFFKNP